MIFLVLFTGNFIFSQGTPHEELPLEELENNHEKKSYDKELQKEFVVVESQCVHEFNPQMTQLSSDSGILENLYEGLFSLNPLTLTPEYAIASEYKISRDKKRWCIKLRDNVRFSNGENIKASDVRDSWLQLLASPGAPYASLFDIVRGAEEYRTGKGKEEDVGLVATDDKTLIIYLNAPANYLPQVLCHSAFSIIHRNPTVFSGAYVLDDVQYGITVLKKNQYYWDKDNVAIEKITFVQSEDMDLNAYLFNTGKVQWIKNNADINKILDKEAVQVNPQFGVSFYFFKMSKNKPTDDKRKVVWDYKEFRTALMEALPWDTMRKGYLRPAKTFVYPLADYPKVEGYDFTDSVEASAKMKAAREKYNIPEDEIIPLVVEIQEGTLEENVKLAIKNALSPIGVDVSFKEVPFNAYFAGLPESDSDLFCYSWIGDFADPLTFLELFSSKSSMNDSGWQNDEYDRLLKAAAVGSITERYKLLAQAENILLDEGMVIPISYPITLNIIDLKEVGGWIPNAFDTHQFKYIYRKRENKKMPNLVMR